MCIQIGWKYFAVYVKCDRYRFFYIFFYFHLYAKIIFQQKAAQKYQDSVIIYCSKLDLCLIVSKSYPNMFVIHGKFTYIDSKTHL